MKAQPLHFHVVEGLRLFFNRLFTHSLTFNIGLFNSCVSCSRTCLRVCDLLWFQRSTDTLMQRILRIVAFHFGPKRVPFWAKTRFILGQNAFHFAAKRVPFCGKMLSILRQNAFHFAAKRVSFCGKTRFILRQNAFYFAAKRFPFCGKMHSILRQNAFHFAAKRLSKL